MDTSFARDDSSRSFSAPKSRRTTFFQKLCAGVPARIMGPRLVFMAAALFLICFGLIMVYSASAPGALVDPSVTAEFKFGRQLIFCAIGLGVAAVLIRCKYFDTSFYGKGVCLFFWAVSIALLVCVLMFGVSSRGATRWLSFMGIRFQPTEFVKPIVVLALAYLCGRYYQEHDISARRFVCLIVALVAPILLLILRQPDMGTALLIVLTVIFVLYMCGLSNKVLITLLVLAALGVAFLLLTTPWRLARFLAFLEPWNDPQGTGYQLVQSLMAFASGGVWGKGIGQSSMKYSFLPEHDTDYILAVVGEECGLVGTTVFILIFLLFVWSGFRIAREARDVQGRCIAYGMVFSLASQFFLNALGVIGIIPLSGKTLPFMSYGGTSLIACIGMAALVVRVSVDAGRATPFYQSRHSLSVVDDAPLSPSAVQQAVSSHLGVSTAGKVRVRTRGQETTGSESSPARLAPRPAPRPAAQPTSRAGFSVYDGKGASARAPRDTSAGPQGYGRVNLHDSASDRLRGRAQGPTVRGRDDSSSSGRGRYDQ